MRLGIRTTSLIRALLPAVALPVLASATAALSAPPLSVVGPVCETTANHRVCITREHDPAPGLDELPTRAGGATSSR